MRELDPESIHWGGYAGMSLRQDFRDPLPDYILGGVPVDDFLDQHLEQVTHPLVAGFGLLADSSSDNSIAWSVNGASYSFYQTVERLATARPSPPLNPDPVQIVPQRYTRTKSVRAVQVSDSTRFQEADVSVETVTVDEVS